MPRLSEKRQIHGEIFIVLLISVRGVSPFEAPSTCTPKNKEHCGGCAEISYSFSRDFEKSDIMVYKGELEEKIVHSFLQRGKREFEKEPGYNFTVETSEERIDCFLIIENVTEHTTGDYVFQALDPPKRCKPCSLEAGIQNTILTVDENSVAGNNKNTEQKETDTDKTSKPSPGAIAGIGMLVVVVGGAAVAVVVFRKWITRMNSSSKKDRNTREGIVPCTALTTRETAVPSTNSSQESTTPLMTV